MKNAADISVKSPTDETKLVVEVVAKRNVLRDWAIKLRRNLLAHGWLPESDYFMVASPHRFFLWKKSRQPNLEREPDYEFDPEPILQPYLQRIQSPLSELSKASFEILVSSWLSDLTILDRSGVAHGANWVLDSGLLEAVRNGSVESETAA